MIVCDIQSLETSQLQPAIIACQILADLEHLGMRYDRFSAAKPCGERAQIVSSLEVCEWGSQYPVTW